MYRIQNFVNFELQDGCLSLEEFLTAMHLVSLKRNNIHVPQTLPPTLKPAYLQQRCHALYSHAKVDNEELADDVTNTNMITEAVSR